MCLSYLLPLSEPNVCNERLLQNFDVSCLCFPCSLQLKHDHYECFCLSSLCLTAENCTTECSNFIIILSHYSSSLSVCVANDSTLDLLCIFSSLHVANDGTLWVNISILIIAKTNLSLNADADLCGSDQDRIIDPPTVVLYCTLDFSYTFFFLYIQYIFSILPLCSK